MKIYFLLLLSMAIASCPIMNQAVSTSLLVKEGKAMLQGEKIDGVSFVSPARKFPATHLASIKTAVGADWVAVSPFAFTYQHSPELHFNSQMQWWGERIAGVHTIINYAHQHNYKVMLKPQVWMMSGWVGDFEPKTASDWQIWEENYENYILSFAKIADSMQVALFCIGTEYRIAAKQRPQYWRKLCKKVKAIYKGPITYAANWDNYENINFWDELDYIGVDAYFPLVDAPTPTVAALVKAWQPRVQKLKKISEQYQRPILFTEYGYMSCDYTAWQNWENENNKANLRVNSQAQSNAFEALYQSLWHKDFFAGGFIWKWYPNYEKAGGSSNKDYTPQNKACEKVIKSYYEM